MLKEVIVVDYQGSEKLAQANYSDTITDSILHAKRNQSLNIEYILVKGEVIYPALDWVFNSKDGSSYYIK
ncbi:hypothetical protein [Acinetobacter proteolyticus]|uniref:hypothetical protein n=1 Tax=Acinetobacter proteolyticus TaxID=1776741 RepID=UPI003D986C19